MTPELVPLIAAAKVLGVSTKTLRNAIAAGEIEAVRWQKGPRPATLSHPIADPPRKTLRGRLMIPVAELETLLTRFKLGLPVARRLQQSLKRAAMRPDRGKRVG